MAQDPLGTPTTPTGTPLQGETPWGADASTNAAPAPEASAEPAAIRVLAAVIERDGRYLICQRPLHKRHGGLWEFPGGKLEPGESDAQAANRELQEELGVTVTAVGEEQYLAHDAGSPFHIAFVPVTIVGQPACLEHAALAWTTPDEMSRYDLAPSDRRFVEAVLRRA